MGTSGGLGEGSFFRWREAAARGLSHYRLQKMVVAGEVERVGGGLYRRAGAEATELETIAMVGAAMPRGIVCLLSALRVHAIGTQAPRAVWMAIEHKARRPVRLPAKAMIVRFSGQMLRYGVVEQQVQGVRVRITTPARTVVDCFRYRRKIGMDVALEALREALRGRKATVDEIARTAEVCRAGTVMRPYLEAVSV